MAELLRIKCVKGVDNGWRYCRDTGIGEILFGHEQLAKHFDVPDDLKTLDVVLHAHPSQDRLNAVCQRDENYDDSYLYVEVQLCNGRWDVWEFPDDRFVRLSPFLHKWMKRTGRKTGDKVYVQIEY